VYDISYFGTAIFQPLILKSIFGSSESLTSLCWQSVVVSAFGLPAAAGELPCRAGAARASMLAHYHHH